MTLRTGKKVLKYIGITLGVIIVLLILATLSLRLASVQNFVKDQVITFVEDKIGTPVSLDRVYVNFPNELEMKNLYLEGQKQDTILKVNHLEVSLNLWELLDNQANLTAVEVEGLVAYVKRYEDDSFNFDYIVDAFAVPDDPNKEEKPFILNLNKIDLENIHVNYDDRVTKNNIDVDFNAFKTVVKEFDLEKNSYGLGDLKMDGLKLKLKQELVKEAAEETTEAVDSLSQQNPLQLALQEIDLTNFDISYDDDISKTYAHVQFKQLFGDVDDINLQKNAYALDELKLVGADIVANLYLESDSNTNSDNTTSTTTDEEPLHLVLNKMSLDNVNVEYNNTAITPTSKGFDYNHLDIDALNFEMDDFEMLNNSFVGNIDKGSFEEKSGFVLKELETDFQYTDQLLSLEDVYLLTDHTKIEDNIQLAYENLEQLSNDTGNAQVDIQLKDSYIGFNDIRTLVPDIAQDQPLFQKYPNAKLHLNTDISGLVNDLDIRKMVVKGPDGLMVNVSGNVMNAMDSDNLAFDLNINELTAQAKTINALLEPGTIPNNISIPRQFTLKGTASGSLEEITTDALITSTDGNAKLRGTIDLSTENQERYNVHLETSNLNVGKIIQNPDVGTISVNMDAQGIGFDPETANADIQGVINSAYYNGYNYQRINVDAKLKDNNFDAHVLSNDPNAELDLRAIGNYADQNGQVNLSGDITKLDLQKLGFYEEPLIIAGKIEGEASDFDMDRINANLELKDLAISDTNDVYPVRDATIEIVNNDEFNSIVLNSSIADAKIEGDYILSEILPVFMRTINSYYKFYDSSASDNTIIENQYFNIKATVKDDPILHKFLPDLNNMQDIEISGSFNADERDIILDVEVPYLSYMGYELNNALVDIDNTDEALNYKINLDGVESEDFAFNELKLNGEVKDNQIYYHFESYNEAGDINYLVGGTLNQNENGNLKISLSPNELVLDQENWQVSEDNSILLADSFVTANNFQIRNGGSAIKIESVNDNPDSPLDVTITDFQIETLTRIIEQDSLLAQGVINGHAILKNPIGDLKFDADINISNFKVYGSDIGDIQAELTESSADRINTDIRLTGFDNKVDITGFYDINASSLDMEVGIDRFNMESIQGLTFNELQEGTGYISGELSLKGKAATPQILGNLNFNDVGMFITQLGTKFQGINDRINFTRQGIQFDHFILYDDNKNEMDLDGIILTTDYSDFAFNLTLDAENFKVVDAERDEDQMLFGVLAINTDLVIEGDLDLPIVTGNLEVDEPTDFTFIMPQSSPTLKEREGVVRFVDRDQIALNETLKNDTIDTTSKIKGIDMSVNISVQPDAKLSMIIDQATGDFVKIQGTAELTGSIDPSGKTSLTGIYEVEEGAYELNFNMLQRRFDIKKGSTITWTGDPMEADIDIIAIYKLEAAPIDLLDQQISSLEPSRLNQYKQRLPFNTILQMEGDLMKPKINFDITLDKENANVATEVVDNTETKLGMIRMEQNEINKQVFSLLLLNRFMGENPFASDSGLSPESMARQSVSRILSEQLNNLASDLIQGVDINFDLESKDDYTTGEKENRTDLNVSLSKRLLNDRLKVTIGNNFGVEGEARENEQMANIAGDITLDYSLSEDGTYILRAYRTNEYQVALQGQVVETGVGFIMTLEYNEFREIFDRLKSITKKKDKD